MQWIDHQCYFGPDRRRSRGGGLRLHERRRVNVAGRPPCLHTALRQLRLHVLDASGKSDVAGFKQRLEGVAILAEQHEEHATARILVSLASALSRVENLDLRDAIYPQIDRARAALRSLN